MKRAIVALVLGIVAFAGCSSDADIASSNLSIAAEQFQIQRRIVFINGITDQYLLTIEGLCSVETSDSKLGGSLEVTCKVGDGEFKKHFLGLSDNVTYLVEQMASADVSTQRYRVIFKPESILPDVDMQ
jgi:hypothetical protein